MRDACHLLGPSAIHGVGAGDGLLGTSACPSRLPGTCVGVSRSQSGLGARTMAWTRARAGSSESAPRPPARPSSSWPGPGFPPAGDALFRVLACRGRLRTSGPLRHQLASSCTARYGGSDSVPGRGHPSGDRPVRARTVITPGLGWPLPSGRPAGMRLGVGRPGRSGPTTPAFPRPSRTAAVARAIGSRSESLGVAQSTSPQR